MAKIASPGRRQNASLPSARPTEPSPDADPQAVFERLIRGLDHGPAPAAPAPRPLLELELGGRVFRLVCQDRPPPVATLSPREQEIARMIALGLPNKAIAGRLEISEWTVGTHLRRIFAKFGVSCRAAMVSKYLATQHFAAPAGDGDRQPPLEA